MFSFSLDKHTGALVSQNPLVGGKIADGETGPNTDVDISRGYLTERHRFTFLAVQRSFRRALAIE